MNVGRYLRGEDSHVGTSRITKSKELKMNDKIREFEIECWVQREHCTAWFDSAKFAELIVRESAEVVNYYHSRNEPVTSQQILRHFGIE